ncbi:sporulation protein, partial [Stenotrophomonas maltophilia]
AAARGNPRRPRPVPRPPAAPAAADNARYILQAGAFGASGDAEATKAKLAMMGLAARVESAQINGKTVYRVRMGPYGSAGELSEAKQKLDGTGLQAMAIKAQ